MVPEQGTIAPLLQDHRNLANARGNHRDTESHSFQKNQREPFRPRTDHHAIGTLIQDRRILYVTHELNVLLKVRSMNLRLKLAPRITLSGYRHRQIRAASHENSRSFDQSIEALLPS